MDRLKVRQRHDDQQRGDGDANRQRQRQPGAAGDDQPQIDFLIGICD
jgi:hypothetical protein